MLPFRNPKSDQTARAVPAASASFGDKLQWLASEHPYTLNRLHDLAESVVKQYRTASHQHHTTADAPPSDVTFQLDAATGRYLSYKEHTPGTLLIAPGDFLGRTCRDVLPPDMVESIERGIFDAVAQQRPQQVSYAFRNRAYRCCVMVRDGIITLAVTQIIASLCPLMAMAAFV